MIFTVIFACAVSRATEYTWTGGGSDNLWGNPDNWDLGSAPDGPDDDAVFETGAAEMYEVEFDRNIELGSLRVEKDRVFFNLNGFTNTLNKTSYFASNRVTTADVRMENGSMILKTPRYFYVAHGNTRKADFVMRGSNTIFDAGSRF